MRNIRTLVFIAAVSSVGLSSAEAPPPFPSPNLKPSNSLPASSVAQVRAISPSMPKAIGPIPAAQSVAPAPIPPMPTPMRLTSSGSNSNVDRILEQISKNMQAPADVVDQQAEASINRDVSLTRSTGQVLRPIGYMEIDGDKSIFAADEAARILRIKPNSRVGTIRVADISEYGVEYTVSGKTMFAPLSFVSSEAPKAPQTVMVNSPAPTDPMTAAMPGGQAGQR